MKKFLKAIVIVSFVGAVGSAAAVTITFQQGTNAVSSDSQINIANYSGTEDTSLIQNFANNNYGGRTDILVGPTGLNQARTGLIRFDVSALDNQYLQINSVTLRLNVDLTSADATFNVVRMNEANIGWVEGNSNGTLETNTSTWSRMVYISQFWAGSSGAETSATDFYSDVLAGASVSTGTTPIGTWVEWNLSPTNFTLTDMIDSWVTNSINPGLLIRRTGQTAQWGFASSENTTQSLRPQLIINYTAIPEPSTTLLVLAGLGLLWTTKRRHCL